MFAAQNGTYGRLSGDQESARSLLQSPRRGRTLGSRMSHTPNNMKSRTKGTDDRAIDWQWYIAVVDPPSCATATWSRNNSVTGTPHPFCGSRATTKAKITATDPTTNDGRPLFHR
jgi:hypothetical protein